MICRDCARGDHCNNTGVNTLCPCQHRPPMNTEWLGDKIRGNMPVPYAIIEPNLPVPFANPDPDDDYSDVDLDPMVTCNRHVGPHTPVQCIEWSKLVDEREGFNE
jgi:hypothetical protein